MSLTTPNAAKSSPSDYQVLAKVTTPVGVFTGFASGDIPNFDDAVTERDGIQEMLRDCDAFTFFSIAEPGTEITVLRNCILDSVFELSIVHGLRDAT
jgi:hypothetical protein